jgi:hypothetical protein
MPEASFSSISVASGSSATSPSASPKKNLLAFSSAGRSTISG